MPGQSPDFSHVAVLVVAAVLISGAIGAAPPTAAAGEVPTVARSLASGVTRSADTDTDSTVTLCRRYLTIAADARTPIDAMRTRAVLFPFVDLIQLGTRMVAEQGGSAADPRIATAMRELAAAQDDLDAQGWRNLPPGADPSETPVWLNPDRLTAALDAADAACSGRDT